MISIHALVKRATDMLPTLIDLLDISIHALVKRATAVWSMCSSYISDFNPRPRKEGDLRHYYMDEIAFISIHALVKRATCV